MKYINILFVLCTVSFISSVQAQQALSKELIQSMKTVMNEMVVLENKYPQIFAELDGMDESEPEKIIAFINDSTASKEVASIVESAGFDNIEEFFQLSNRLSSSMMAYQQDNMPEGMNFDAMNKMRSDSIQLMKDNNVPSSLIAEMQVELDNSIADTEKMRIAAKSANAADKKFISENIQWVMSVFDDGE